MKYVEVAIALSKEGCQLPSVYATNVYGSVTCFLPIQFFSARSLLYR